MHRSSAVLSVVLAISHTNAQVSESASSVFPTIAPATPVPVGDPYNILTYPICAQTCGNETAPFLAANVPGCNAGIIGCACGTYYRSTTAGCENVTCSEADYETTQELADQLCGPLYSNDSVLSTSVSSAIASATADAASAVAGKDVFNLADYPACAQNCTIENNYGGCGSQNASCICSPPASVILGNCEVIQCSPSDLETIGYLSYRLCGPVGGIQEPSNLTGSGVLTIGTNTSTPASPTPIAFTGSASIVGMSAGIWVSSIMLAALMGALIVL